jgi:methylenetetrahydrofolate dehydrogenase (NADP+)/methenyltetrahydrofolate cyclohydrolase
MSPVVLDGVTLAERRAPLLAERAAAVRGRRGHAPAFVIVAFGDDRGHVPHVARKTRMCAAAGVAATPLVMRPDVPTGEAIGRMQDAVNHGRFDGVFVQFPFPGTIAGDAFAAALPVELDVDIMTPVRTARFMNGHAALPPVTVSACLLLLDAYGVSIVERRGIIVADESPFSLMFRRALSLRGARMQELVGPTAPDLIERVGAADVVVVAAAAAGLVHSAMLSPGTIVIDAGYFNPGGRGDIDVTGGIDHLAALAPVPGGIGPMTVSSLIERVILFAEGGSEPVRS